MQELRRQSTAASYCLFVTPVEPFSTAGYSTVDAPPDYRSQVTACLLHLQYLSGQRATLRLMQELHHQTIGRIKVLLVCYTCRTFQYSGLLYG